MSAPTISHPTDRPNFTVVTTADATYWFSYRTCIAFHTDASGTIVRENVWGPTTGKHLNYVDSDKSARVSGEMFQTLLAKYTSSEVTV